ncbi:PREDICTED: ankyrin repeat domain-containing protein 7-like [Amphimedon queenslandica]|uniref:Uncharacterized protein n=1 Tax=Amphimedon queenslandica TaxID=400682 RepID=A0AAN0JU61_AMPQE|nr:PREDICTED: ankyrin repeat domain-containing protein 7-like [Amphimedon queenslandica]|eukprot:XP_019860424.1 PREDICTED: ankyrin repeat domain-containing protein 7-like [Amphimedon queenslandica]
MLYKKTPLHEAALYNRSNAVQWLLSKGADLESRDDDGWTPLIVAAANGHTQVVTMLLEKGADVTASDNAGKTALDYAYGDTATILRVHSGNVFISLLN